MVSVRNTRRKSGFGTNEHPANSNPLETATPVLEASNSPAKGNEAAKKTKAAEQPQEASAKVKSSFYVKSDALDRMREAFLRTKLDEGYESFSDFIVRAVVKETQRLEKKYNGGEPYPGLKQLSSGRPLKI